MTSYVSIPNGDIDQDSPITQPLMTALRDNPIAIAEGEGNAPKVRIGALQRLNPGTSIRSRIDTENTTTATSDNVNSATVIEDVYSFSFLQAGTIRLTFEHYVSVAGSSTVSVRRFRNGAFTTIDTFTSTASYVARSLDVPVLPGDTLTVRATSATPGFSTRTTYTKNIRLQTNGEDLYPGSYAPLEGNTYA